MNSILAGISKIFEDKLNEQQKTINNLLTTVYELESRINIQEHYAVL